MLFVVTRYILRDLNLETKDERGRQMHSNMVDVSFSLTFSQISYHSYHAIIDVNTYCVHLYSIYDHYM